MISNDIRSSVRCCREQQNTGETKHETIVAFILRNVWYDILMTSPQCVRAVLPQTCGSAGYFCSGIAADLASGVAADLISSIPADVASGIAAYLKTRH
jgi:hypothetical protein